MIRIRSVVISGLVVGLAIPVMAQEMRCGEELISGDQIEPLLSEQVLEKCGEHML